MRIMPNWESRSSYEEFRCGPDIKSILNSTAFTKLESRTQCSVLNWYNKLAEIDESYCIGIVPLEQIELVYGAHGLCPPGVGKVKYRIMGRALHTLLSMTLLPMQGNSDGSTLAQALQVATNKSQPNGYDLLHTVLKKTVPLSTTN